MGIWSQDPCTIAFKQDLATNSFSFGNPLTLTPAMIYKIEDHYVSIRTSEPLAVGRYSTTTITAYFKNYVPELTKYDRKQLFYYEIPADCEFSPIF
jgi:hypothetical protein